MRDFKIDGKTQRVFVLKQTDTALVYIPLKVLTRVDYDRLVEIEKEAGSGEMLNTMKKKKLDNGRNALALYDSIIQVAKIDKNDNVLASRLIKPGEAISDKKEAPKKEATPVQSTTEDTPKPRGRGRPKKNPTE